MTQKAQWRTFRDVPFILNIEGVPVDSDIYDERAYVGRIKLRNLQVYGMIVPGKKIFIVGNRTMDSRECEYLVRPENKVIKWVFASNGYVPPNSVKTDLTNDQEVFIGRAPVSDKYFIGYFTEEDQNLTIDWIPENIKYPNYDALTFQ